MVQQSRFKPHKTVTSNHSIPYLKKKESKTHGPRHSYLPPPITSTTHAPLPFTPTWLQCPVFLFKVSKKIISSITLTQYCSFKLQTDKKKKKKKKRKEKSFKKYLPSSNNHQLYIISFFSYSKLNKTVTVRSRR